MKDYNVIIDGQNFIDQPVKNKLEKIWSDSKNCNWPRRWLHD